MQNHSLEFLNSNANLVFGHTILFCSTIISPSTDMSLLFPLPIWGWSMNTSSVFMNQTWMVASWQKSNLYVYVFFHLSNQNVEELPYHSHAHHASSKYGIPKTQIAFSGCPSFRCFLPVPNRNVQLHVAWFHCSHSWWVLSVLKP